MSRRILVVEDEELTAMAIADSLHSFGYEVSAASEGGEALKQVEAFSPDLALMDIKLRGSMDGIEVATRIRNRFNVPCVYLTAFCDDATFQRASAAEPLGYLQKPFQKDELRNTIEIALRNHAREKEPRSAAALMNSILDSSADAAFVTDADGNIRLMNRRLEKLSGYAQQDVLGKALGEFLRKSDGGGIAVQPPSRSGMDSLSALDAVLLASRGDRLPVSVNIAWLGAEDGRRNGAYILLHEPEARREISRGSERETVAWDWGPGAAKDHWNESDSRPLAIEQLETLVRKDGRAFVACFALERFALIRKRFGARAAQQVLEFYSVCVADRLSPEDQLIRWGGCGFLAVLHRPNDSTDEVRKALSATAPSKLDYYLNSGRAAVIALSAKWTVLPWFGEKSLESLIAKIDGFLRSLS